jgi:hypothetical protein
MDFFYDQLSNMNKNDEEYEYHKNVYIDEVKNTRLWKYCSNDKFIEIINKTLLKQYKKKISPVDTVEKMITQHIENISDKEYDEFTLKKDRQKSRQNEIGLFHQYILGACDGWESSDKGIDLYNKKRGIYLQLKNRYNTLNSSSREFTLKQLHNLFSDTQKCYLGYIIPKNNSFEKKIFNYNVIEICGENLYELITGSKSSKLELEKAIKYYLLYKNLK